MRAQFQRFFTQHFAYRPLRVAMCTFIVTVLALGHFDLIKMHLPYDGCDCAICRPSVYLDETPLAIDYGVVELILIDEYGNEATIPAQLRGQPGEDTLEVFVRLQENETEERNHLRTASIEARDAI